MPTAAQVTLLTTPRASVFASARWGDRIKCYVSVLTTVLGLSAQQTLALFMRVIPLLWRRSVKSGKYD